MKLTITGVLLGCLSGWLAGCGSFSTDQTLAVEMYGVSKSPETAVGDRDPKFQIYQLLKVDMLSEDGSSVTNLFDNDEEKIFRIVDREQLILSKTIDDYVGESFSEIQLTFAEVVTGGLSSDEELEFTMSTPTLSLVESITVKKAKSLTLQVKISWGNTISDDGMSEPAYELILD